MHFTNIPDVVDVLGELIRQQYIVMQDQRNYLLNVPDLLSNTGSVWKSQGSSKNGTFFLVLLPLSEKLSTYQLTIAKYQRTLP